MFLANCKQLRPDGSTSLQRLGFIEKSKHELVTFVCAGAIALYVLLKPIKYFLVSSGHDSLEEPESSGDGNVVQKLLSGEGEVNGVPTQYVVIGGAILLILLILSLFSRRRRR